MAASEKDVEVPEIETDGNVIAVAAVAVVSVLQKSLDVNKYATKKTIAQGLLDVALLTANASQLKYVLQVGEKHEFYSLMLSLISLSIVLQLIVAILFVIIGGLNINKSQNHRAAIVLNDSILIFIFLISVINVTAGLLSVLIGILKSYDSTQIDVIIPILNQIALGFVTGALFCDIIKMNFGLDPALPIAQACLCVLLGSTLNINKEDHCPNANKANNTIMCINIVIMAINVLISSFEMKEGSDVLALLIGNRTQLSSP
ncbi:hypothetical protein YQE_05229, partial [Dendroctonus ponderosae]